MQLGRPPRDRRPRLKEFLLHRAQQQERLLNQFVNDALPPSISVWPRHSDDQKWHFTRYMDDTTAFNSKRCYLAASKAVPGLLGVFAEEDFRATPHPRSLSAAPSKNIAYYGGVVLLKSEFDDGNASLTN